MRRIHVDLRPKAMRVDDANVGPLGGMVLMTIDESAPISIQDLAAKLARDKGQMTRYIQTLERKELIERVDWPEDRRVSLVRLTPAGLALVTAFREALADVVDALLIDIDAAERGRLLATLQKLLQTETGTERAGGDG